MRTATRLASLPLAFVFALLLFLPTRAVAQTWLVDTGPGHSDGTLGIGLDSSGSTICSPQPSCSLSFQFLAGQFTLSAAASLDTVQGWASAFGSGGEMDVKIYSDNANTPGVSIASKRYTIPFLNGYGWLSFSNYGVALAAGTYWIALEPVAGTQNRINGMYGGAPNPLPRYAVKNQSSNGYRVIPQSLGFRIGGTPFPELADGTATRTILEGSEFGFPITPTDVIRGGNGELSTSAWNIAPEVGWSYGRGDVIENSLSAGAYAAASGGTICSGTCGIAAGRGIAYRSWKNLTTQSLTLRLNAELHGAFFGTGGRAIAGVYTFDPAQFTNTILASGLNAAQFLLRQDGLLDIARADNSLSLARLFPGTAIITNTIETALGQDGVPMSVPVTSPFFTVAPGNSITVMFDVAVFEGGGGSANFASTLVPARNFFTDTNGSPVTGLVAVGPSTSVATPTAIALTPSTATAPVGTSQSVTATVSGAGGAPVPNATVFFTIVSGPNTAPSGPTVTDASGQAVFTYTDAAGVAATDTIQATIGALQSNAAQVTWQIPGPMDHITVNPASATVAVGEARAYTAEAFDRFNNSRGDVTGDTVFAIAPDGSCAGAVCTAAAAGSHTVTGTYAGKSATATLMVTAPSTYAFEGFFQPIDMSSPGVTVWNSAKAGQAIPVKWRLTQNGAPVSDARSFVGVFSYPVSCTSGASIDAPVEEFAPGNSALTYAGDGNWQFNWATLPGYKGTCRMMIVKFGDGSTSVAASFKFK